MTQTPGARLENWASTLTLLEDLIRRGAAQHAELIVLPECAWPAYVLGSRAAYDAARANGLPPPTWFLERMQAAARDAQIAVCVGHVDECPRPGPQRQARPARVAHARPDAALGRASSELRNAATLIGADGRILGTRHKCFLWDFDHDYFAAGDRLEPIDTEFGRIGLMICADARLPEIPATLVASGARLLLQPTAWVNAGTPDRPWNPQPEFLIPARALEFGVPVASASKVGVEGGTAFVGGSLICDVDGLALVRCQRPDTELQVTDVALGSGGMAGRLRAELADLATRGPPEAPSADVPALWIATTAAGGRQDRTAPDAAAGASTGVRAVPHLLIAQSDDDATRLVAPNTVVLAGPSPDVQEIDRIRFATIAAPEAAAFAPCRRLALAGVHVVVVFGTMRIELLRARACENRMFMVRVDADGLLAIDPRGCVSDACAWGAERGLWLAVHQAANKDVARQTNILNGRLALPNAGRTDS